MYIVVGKPTEDLTMKRIWKNEEGVSPVIAVILMVAITVVLAAVLYVMVSGMLTGGGSTPNVSMNWIESDDNPGNYTGNVLRISGGDPPKLTDVTIVYIQTPSTGSDLLSVIVTDDLEAGAMTMRFSDNDVNLRLGGEDTFSLEGVHEGDIIRLTYKPSSGEMYSQNF